MVKVSSTNSQPITADTGGIKKNKAEVLLAEPFLIKNIKIVKAPKETAIICQAIANTKEVVKLIKGLSKEKERIKRKILALKDW